MGDCRAGFLDEGFRLFSFRNGPPVEVSVQLYLAAIVQAEGSEDLAIWGFGSGSFRPESPPFFCSRCHYGNSVVVAACTSHHSGLVK